MPVSPTGFFEKSLDSLYVTDSPLCATNIAELASLNYYFFGDGTVSPTDKVLTVSLSQIVL